MIGIVSFGVWRNLFSVVVRGGLPPPGELSTPAPDLSADE